MTYDHYLPELKPNVEEGPLWVYEKGIYGANLPKLKPDVEEGPLDLWEDYLEYGQHGATYLR